MAPTLRNDPRVAKMMATRRGRIAFATGAGLVLLQAVTALKALGEVIDVWVAHLNGPPPKPLPVGELARMTLPAGYAECGTCFAAIDERARVCPACRTPDPHGRLADAADRIDEERRGELLVDVAELRRP